MNKRLKNKKAWIISVNMGYGHQRTAFPLRDLAPEGKIINANDYSGIPEKDRRIWETTQKSYEFISNLKKIPLIGEFIFFIFDQFQKILSFYPKRDLSKPSFQLRQIFSLIKKGWGKHFIEELRMKDTSRDISHGGSKYGKLRMNLPIVSSFFTPAFMAEYFNYPGEIYTIICDADISRTWADFNVKSSKIKYFAPTSWVQNRLKLYGVKEKNIFFTGYPLPEENIGSERMEILKDDLKHRLLNLDPQKRYFEQYKSLIGQYLGKLPKKSDHPLTIMFSVGGAGAQKEIGLKILKSFAHHIKKGEIKIILSAGIKKDIKNYFEDKIKKLNLKKYYQGRASSSIEVLFGQSIDDYFQKFNQALRKTDILWTKPSELSFYTALGLPIIIAPTIGSQEEFNKKWLLRLGAGIIQENPDYVNQWLFDFISSGRFAQMAMEGFIKAEKLGSFKIKKIISSQ